jgi:hypothetical protein
MFDIAVNAALRFAALPRAALTGTLDPAPLNARRRDECRLMLLIAA